MNILLQTGRDMETSLLNECAQSAADLLFVSLLLCFAAIRSSLARSYHVGRVDPSAATSSRPRPGGHRCMTEGEGVSVLGSRFTSWPAAL